jgi:hypothetical protein
MHLLTLVLILAQENPLEMREQANARACCANQRTIAGAINLYVRDKHARVREIDRTLIDSLKNGHYLDKIPDDPGRGEGTSKNYYMTNDPRRLVACRFHTSVCDPALVPASPSPVSTRTAEDAGANVRACHTAQKVIATALEMYKGDTEETVTALDATLFQTLIKGRYMNEVPIDPGQGAKSAGNYYLVPTGNGVACKIHGQAP